MFQQIDISVWSCILEKGLKSRVDGQAVYTKKKQSDEQADVFDITLC